MEVRKKERGEEGRGARRESLERRRFSKGSDKKPWAAVNEDSESDRHLGFQIADWYGRWPRSFCLHKKLGIWRLRTCDEEHTPLSLPSRTMILHLCVLIGGKLVRLPKRGQLDLNVTWKRIRRVVALNKISSTTRC